MVTDNKKAFEEVSFKKFLTKYRVVIPMVQRDYAQGRETEDINRVRNRFLEAIKTCLIQDKGKAAKMKLDFVYGEKEQVWSKTEPGKLDYIIITPLDGQQRLTTLYLLHWYASRCANTVDYAFLNHFTYDIRPSSRDFCAKLIDYRPDVTKQISSQITDQNWFQGEWHNDPTIICMLVMLDAIQAKFSNIDNLWGLLTGDEQRIIFYFLPLSENGFSDELYIKMNSRGKKLTAFEHFKAEYEELYERDSEEAMSVNHKFDVEWADTLFDYRDSNDNTIDKEFMRYFFYISHILCYQQSITKSNDEFDLIDSLYKNTPRATENKQFLEKAFDCWYDVKNTYGTIDRFFEKYLSTSAYEKDKVTTFKSIAEYKNSQNFFNACVKLYQINNNFSYGDFLFLYGIITYLLNKDSIDESDFRERIRILRNLIFNSNTGEIRGDADYMKDLLCETKILITTGRVERQDNHGFNGFQEKEEQDKINIKAEMSEKDLNLMCKFEDHPLIYGFISGLGYDNLNLVDSFYNLFNDSTDYMLVHRAMISIDDYTQNDNSRYYMGNSNRSTWANLLHRSIRRDVFDDRTMPVLRNLLQLLNEGKTLDGIINDFINDRTLNTQYTWRYYFAKYEDMLRGADGELSRDEDYVWTTLNRHQFYGKHWNSVLNVIVNKINKKGVDKKFVALSDYGDNLTISTPISSIESLGDKYVYYLNDTKEEWIIEQDQNVDTIDRIMLAESKIMDIIGKSENNHADSHLNQTYLKQTENK